MVEARRAFDGRVALTALERLLGSLHDGEGEVRFTLDFGTDVLRLPYVDLRIEADLPLQCQRSLRRFLLPVRLQQRLGLIREEDAEAALPAECEPLLVAADGNLRPLELVEDELILALPVVPVSPEAEAVEREFAPTVEEVAKASPFAGLVGLKTK